MKKLIKILLIKIVPLRLIIFLLPKKVIFYSHIFIDFENPLKEVYNPPTFSEIRYLIKLFKRCGYTFLNFNEHINSIKKKSVHITLDDGYKQIFENYNKYLDLNVPFSIYIIGNAKNNFKIFSNITNNYISYNEFLEIKEIEFLKKHFEIGYHTLNHYNLNLLSDRELIKECKIPNGFQKILSLPYSSYDDELVMKLSVESDFILGTNRKSKVSNYFSRICLDYSKNNNDNFIKNLKINLIIYLKNLYFD